MANLELALPHLREAARIYRANNHVDTADAALRDIADVEKGMRLIGIAIATAGTAAAGAAAATRG